MVGEAHAVRAALRQSGASSGCLACPPCLTHIHTHVRMHHTACMPVWVDGPASHAGCLLCPGQRLHPYVRCSQLSAARGLVADQACLRLAAGSDAHAPMPLYRLATPQARAHHEPTMKRVCTPPAAHHATPHPATVRATCATNPQPTCMPPFRVCVSWAQWRRPQHLRAARSSTMHKWQHTWRSITRRISQLRWGLLQQASVLCTPCDCAFGCSNVMLHTCASSTY